MASAEEKADYLFSEDLVRSHNSAASMHTEHLCLFANYVESKGVQRKAYELEI